MAESESGPRIRLSAFAGEVFKGTGTLVMVGCPQCIGVAPVADGVIGEHAGLSRSRCSYAGVRVSDDLFAPEVYRQDAGGERGE